MPPKKSDRLTFEKREKRLLAAAETLFSKKGFAGTTTKALAEKAGINEALLFRHYPCKKDLYTAYVRQKLADWSLEFIPQLEKATALPLPKILLQIAELTVERHRKDPHLLRAMMFSSLEDPKLGCLFFKEKLPLADFIQNLFQERIRRGEMKHKDAIVASHAFLSLIHHYILVAEIFKAKGYYQRTESEMLKGYIEIFTKGVL